MVPCRGEVGIPRVVTGDGAVTARNRDGVVTGSGVDDHDLVDDAAQRREARVEVVGFVADDDGGRQEHGRSSLRPERD